MKKSISWHKECLKNSTLYLQETKRAIGHLQEKVKEDENRVWFLAKQIITAEKEGKDSFDSERYLVKRKSGEGNLNVGEERLKP